MKFLLFQMMAYVFAAMLIGAGLATVWARATNQHLRRNLERIKTALNQEAAANETLRTQRAADQSFIGETTELAVKLTELRAAMALVEADVRANQLAKAEAERSLETATAALDLERGASVRLGYLEAENAKLRIEHRQSLIALAEIKSEYEFETNALRSRNETLSSQLVALEAIHDRIVVSSQQTAFWFAGADRSGRCFDV